MSVLGLVSFIPINKGILLNIIIKAVSFIQRCLVTKSCLTLLLPYGL